MSGPLRVLCIDMGTGKGGASRSLLMSLARIDQKKIHPVVWGRSNNALQSNYAGLGISFRAIPDMPVFRALPEFLLSIIDLGKGLLTWFRHRTDLKVLAKAIGENFDLVHLNHEGLFLLAWALKRNRLGVPIVMHMRTNCHDTILARWQMRQISRLADHLVFITENEESTFKRLGGTASGTVIYNIAELPAGEIRPHPAIPADDRFKVMVLSVYSWLKGIDRAIDIARALAAIGRRDILFVMAGDMRVSGKAPGLLGAISNQKGTLEDYARECHVSDMFQFLGHVRIPEEAILACDLVLKPTRENNPWGRDHIEALACARPVMSVGWWSKFVETGVTGVLLNPFDPVVAAEWIVRMADDRKFILDMGKAGQERIREMCSGVARAADLAGLWKAVSLKIAA